MNWFSVAVLVVWSAILYGIGFHLRRNYQDAEQLGTTISRKSRRENHG